MYGLKVMIMIVGLLHLAVGACAQAAPFQVYTAASLQDVVRELCKHYESHSQGKIWINAAASGVLANQIIHGAPAHVYISANQKWMKELQRQGFIAPQQVSIIASNRLVVTTAKTMPLKTFEAISQFPRIALGNPKTVPAGQYAMEALETAGLVSVMQEKFIFAKDVRDALRLATTKIVPAAFVYQSDAQVTQQATIAFVVPEKYHTPIHYWAGITQQGEKHDDAKGFIKFITDPAARTIWIKHGLIPGDEEIPEAKP